MSLNEGGTVTWILVHTIYWKKFIDRESKSMDTWWSFMEARVFPGPPTPWTTPL